MAGAARLQRFESAEPHMGTLVRITLYAPSTAEASAAFQRAFTRIRHLDDLLSDYKPESEVSRVSTTPTPASPALQKILAYALRLSQQTQGAFDVTAGPLTLLWRQARRQNRLPDPAAIEAARLKTGYRKLHLKDGKVWFEEPGMRLDLGAIAKGFAADEALRAARLPRALVAISGDIAIGAPPPGRKRWRVQLAANQSTVELRNRGVSTSGDTEQYLEAGGVHYSHILDPRTGRPLTHTATVSVIARTAMEADAIATAACVTGWPRFPHATVFHSAP